MRVERELEPISVLTLLDVGEGEVFEFVDEGNMARRACLMCLNRQAVVILDSERGDGWFNASSFENARPVRLLAARLLVSK